MSEIIRSNIMQRLYDELPAPESPPNIMLSIAELSTTLHFSPRTIIEALDRLRRLRCTRTVCVDGVWRYGRRSGARRPADSRGRRKR